MSKRLAVFVALALSLAGIQLSHAETLADLAAAAREAMAETAAPVQPVSAPVQQMAPVAMLTLPVPLTTISVGDTITAGLIQERSFAPNTGDRIPVFTNRAGLVGKVARRVLIAGNPIPVNAVGTARVITRGVAATIYFEEGGLSIRSMGMPLEPGSPGAVIRLKNLDSGQIVTGTVQSDGSVKVGG